MKINEMKMLSNVKCYIEGTEYTCIVEQVKNSYYGAPRYEVIVITPTYGTYKVKLETYIGISLTADMAVRKVLDKLSKMK